MRCHQGSESQPQKERMVSRKSLGASDWLWGLGRPGGARALGHVYLLGAGLLVGHLCGTLLRVWTLPRGKKTPGTITLPQSGGHTPYVQTPSCQGLCAGVCPGEDAPQGRWVVTRMCRDSEWKEGCLRAQIPQQPHKQSYICEQAYTGCRVGPATLYS